MKAKLKRALSLLLSLIMIMGCMSLPAFATDKEVTVAVTLPEGSTDIEFYSASALEPGPFVPTVLQKIREGLYRVNLESSESYYVHFLPDDDDTDTTFAPQYDENEGRAGDDLEIVVSSSKTHLVLTEHFDEYGTSIGWTYSWDVPETPTVQDFYQDDEGVYHIANLAGLKEFRDSVNGGEKYTNKTVQLDANIDLVEDVENNQQVSWVPIGLSNAANQRDSSIYFGGTFDGNNHTISNLYIYNADLSGAGLFGVIKSGGGVQNLTLNNVNITAKSWIGSVAGCTYGSTLKLSNCSVIGTIDIDGHYMMGGLVGQAYSDFENCTVNGTNKADSHIVATYQGEDLEADKVGGITGHWKDGYAPGNMTNCSVSNLSLAGSRDVGGMIGLNRSYDIISQCSVSNLTITANTSLDYATSKASKLHFGGAIGSFYSNGTQLTGSVQVSVQNINLCVENSGVEEIARMGYISGGEYGSTSMAGPSSKVTNAGITVSGTNSSQGVQSCDNEFVQAPGVTSTVNYVAQIGTTKYETLEAAIAAAPENSETTITVLSDIDLGTLPDSALSSDTGLLIVPEGKNIILDLNGCDIHGELLNYSSYARGHILLNKGTLTIQDSSTGMTGKIRNTGTNCADCTRAIKNDGTLVINSGNFITASATLLINIGSLTINNGNFTTYGWWLGAYLNATAVIDNRSNLTINGGTFTSAHQKSDNGRATTATLYVSGPTTITGGTFNGQPEYGVFDGTDSHYVISGGSFSSDPTNLIDQTAYHVADSNGLYSVHSNTVTAVYAASYDVLKDALDAATTYNTANVTLTADITLAGDLTIKHGSVINLGGHTLTVADNTILTNNGRIVGDDFAENDAIVVEPNGFLTNPVSGVDIDNIEMTRTNGIVGGVYTISNPMDLQWLGCLNTTGLQKIVLGADVEIPGGVVFEPIDSLGGVEFDGRNHSITGVTIEGVSGDYGLFIVVADTYMHDLAVTANISVVNAATGVIAGQIQGGTTLKNVTTNGTINASGTSYGVAGFAGSIAGGTGEVRFVNCTNNVDATAPNATIAGGFHGTSSGFAQGIYYINCTNNGDMIADLYAANSWGYGYDELYLYNFTAGGTMTGSTTFISAQGGPEGTGTIIDTTKVARTGTATSPVFHETLAAAIAASSNIMLLTDCADAYELTVGTPLVVDEVAGQCTDITAPAGYTVQKTMDGTIATYAAVKQNNYVAQIGETKYETLTEAIAAVPANGTPTTITMIGDETISTTATGEVITIASGKNIVLDLNGKTISGTSTEKSNYFIANYGTLKVQDTSTNADGKITFEAVADSGYSVENVTVYNENGTLTLTSGIIENTTEGGLSYAVKNSSNAWGHSVVSTFNMTGGILRGAKTDNTLRVYQNTGIGWKVDSKNYVNISGGTIENGIFTDTFLHTTNQNATGFAADDITKGCVIDTKINISGGTINGLVDMKIRHPYSTELNITGGDFTSAKLQVRKYASEYGAGLTAGTIPEPTEPMVKISGGNFTFANTGKTFLPAYDSTTTSWTSYSNQYSLTGGTFNVDPDATYVAAGYEAVDNGDGTWTVGKPTSDKMYPVDVLGYDEAGVYVSYYLYSVSGNEFGVTGPEDFVATKKSYNELNDVQKKIIDACYDFEGCTDDVFEAKFTFRSPVESYSIDLSAEETHSLNDDMLADNETIELSQDVVLSETFVVDAGATRVLDLKGHSISVAADFKGFMIENNGTLTIKDTVGDGKIDFSNAKIGTYGVSWGVIENNGTLTIESGHITGKPFTAPKSLGIQNKGTLTINGGTFDGNTRALNNSGSAVINGGTFDSKASPSTNWYMYTAGNVGQNSSMVVNNATMTGSHGALFVANGYLEVNGGEFTGTSYYGLYAAGEYGKIEAVINGGTFTSIQQAGALVGNDNDGGIKEEASVVIKGGKFIAKNADNRALNVAANTGKPIVYGGLFSGKTDMVSKYLGKGYSLKPITEGENSGYYTVIKNAGSVEQVNQHDNENNTLTIPQGIANIVDSTNDTTSITTGTDTTVVGSVTIEGGSTIEKTNTNPAEAVSDNNTKVTVQEVEIKKNAESTTVYAVTTNAGTTLANATVGNGMDSNKKASEYVPSVAQKLAKAVADSNKTINSDVEVDLNLNVVATAKPEDQGGDVLASYNVNLKATTTVIKDGETTTTTADVSNDEIAKDAKFTFTLDVEGANAGDPVKVLHYNEDDDSTVDETLFGIVDTNNQVQVTVSHFSTFKVVSAEKQIDISMHPILVALDLEDSISIVFMIHEGVTIPEGATYQLFLQGRGNATYTAEGNVTDAEPYEMNEETYRMFKLAVPAQYIVDKSDKVALSFYDGNEVIPFYDGTSLLENYQASVADYLNATKVNDNNSEELKALASSLLDYGALAKQYLANQNGKNQIEIGSFNGNFNGISKDYFKDYAATRSGSIDGLSYYGASVSLLSQMRVNLFFRLSDGITKEQVEAIEFTVEESGEKIKATVQSNGKFAVLTLPGVSPDKLADKITVTYGGFKMEYYSVFSYARTLAQSKDVTSNAAYLLRAIANYRTAAAAYVAYVASSNP